jgi:hypothetical protein
MKSMQIVDLAIWLTYTSPWPEIVEFVQVDPWIQPFEIVQSYLQEHQILMASKVAIGRGKGVIHRFYRVRLEDGV